METKKLLAGAVVKIGGIPVQITQDVEAETHASNWRLIEEASAIEADVTAADIARTKELAAERG